MPACPPARPMPAGRYLPAPFLPRLFFMPLSLSELKDRAEYLDTDAALHAVMAAAYAPDHPFSLRTFTDEGEAMRWLLAQPAP